MKKIGVIPNTEKDRDLAFTQEILKWLVEKKCSPLLSLEISSKINLPQYGVPAEKIYEESDFIVVLGGDGTILNVAASASISNTPLLGINLGTLGYLAEVEKSGAFEALEKALLGNYSLQKRMMLEASVRGRISQKMSALNDACILKGTHAKLISTRLEINGEYINTLRADGIIISTPTGSTAYNLSAGGPILKPDGEMIAITPICPHMLYSRPFVISAGDTVTIKIEHGVKDDGNLNNPISSDYILNDCILMMDGQNREDLYPGDIVTVRRSKHCSAMIKTNDLGFYDIMRRKMMN